MGFCWISQSVPFQIKNKKKKKKKKKKPKINLDKKNDVRCFWTCLIAALASFHNKRPLTRDFQSTNTFNDSLKNTHSRLLNVYFIHPQSTNSLPNVNQKLLSTKKLTLTCYDATKCLQNVYQGRLSP